MLLGQPAGFRNKWPLVGRRNERSREFTDALHEVWGITEIFNFAHDRAADYGRVREPPHRTYLFRSRDSESDCNGQIADGAHAVDQSFSIARHLIVRACYASARHGVDKSARLLRDMR